MATVKKDDKKDVKKDVIEAINKMDRETLIRFIQFLDMLEGKQTERQEVCRNG